MRLVNRFRAAAFIGVIVALAGLVPGTAMAGDGVKTVGVGDNYFACALKLDKTVWCWGSNEYRETGDGSTADVRTTPVRVKRVGGELKNITQIGVGSYHSCARRDDGTAWCWGEAGNKLGANGTSEVLRAVQVPGLTNVKQVAAGLGHSCALKTGGSVWCWGDGAALGDGVNVSTATPVRVKTKTGFLTDIVRLEAHHGTTCALRSDGVLFCWGQTGPHLLNLEDTSVARSLKIGSGVNRPETFSLGYELICVIRTTDQAWCWGRNGSAQVGDGGFDDTIVPQRVERGAGFLPAPSVIAAGVSVACAAAGSDDHVFCWGSNNEGRAGTGADPGPLTSATKMKRANGQPVAAIAVSSGDSLTCVVRPDRVVMCTGYGFFGGIGNGTQDSANVLTKVLFPG